jgi:hypothetical protein
MRKATVGVLAIVASGALFTSSAFAAQPTASETKPLNIDAGGYVRMPRGRVHSSCVHRVPRGARVRQGSVIAADGAVLFQYEGRCKFSALDNNGRPLAGLTSYVESRNADVIESSSEQWFFDGQEATLVVPATPSGETSTEVFFLFPSFEGTSGSAIIQTVLQFGDTAAGGGEFYGIVNMYGDSEDNWYISELERVNPGDTLYMSMFADSCTSDGYCYWGLEVDDYTISPAVSTYESIDAVDSFDTAYAATLESNIGSPVTACNQLPNSGGVTFTDEYFYEPGYDSGFYYQDVTSSLSWGSRFTGSGSSPLCAWGQSGVSSHSSTLSW